MRIAVVGAGAMGSASAWWLARSGHEVVVFEQFSAGHDRGSSHGRSRIFRFAYPEPGFVALARQAARFWQLLEDESGTAVLQRTGGVDHGPAEAIEELANVLRAAGLPHERVSAEEASERWPGLRFAEQVLYQPQAGRLDADSAVRVLQQQATENGAELRCGDPVAALDVRPDGVRARTRSGEYPADIAVLAAGAWMAKLPAAAALLPALRVTQEQPAYFPPTESADGWPTFIHHGAVPRYGLFTPDQGVKVGEHGTGPEIDPDRPAEPDPATTNRLEAYARDWLPGVRPVAERVDRCLYTNTPDENFVIRRRGPVVVCSACSGHGFKFTPAIGAWVAALVEGKVAGDTVDPRRMTGHGPSG
jgi:sarcosine oxidase